MVGGLSNRCKTYYKTPTRPARLAISVLRKAVISPAPDGSFFPRLLICWNSKLTTGLISWLHHYFSIAVRGQSKRGNNNDDAFVCLYQRNLCVTKFKPQHLD